MDRVPTSRLRNVVLAGHAGSGKTTLAEHLLHTSGAISRLGRVDDGTSSLDFEPEEQKRKLSLSLAVGSLEHDGTRITLLDSPGYADFVGEVVEGFVASDAALLTMDASGGVEAGTEAAIALGRRTNTAALFVLTKCDRENADPSAALDMLRASFGNKIAPLQIAIGKAETFRGYVDLVHRKAYEYDGPKRVEVPIPDELADEVARRRDQLLEAAAEADDDVLTKYLEGEEVSDEELDACLHRGVRDSILAPVVLTAAHKEIGVAGLLDVIVRYLPSPDEEPPVKATERGKDVEITCDPDGPLLRQVFKTAADPFVGRLTFFRVFSRVDQVARPRLEPEPRRGGADRPGAHGPRQGPRADGAGRGGRDRRRGEAAPHRHRRHADVAGAAVGPAAVRLPPADAADRDRAADEGGPGQDGRRAQPDAGGGARPSGSSDPSRPASRSSGRRVRARRR